MKNLKDKINGKETQEVNEDLIREYYERNERKKKDEKWLKKNRPLIISEFQKMGKDQAYYNNIRVNVTIPDKSSFNPDKIVEFAEKANFKNKIMKEVLDEDKLSELIENGEINLAELKAYAWEERKGSPRVTLAEIENLEEKLYEI